MMKMLIDERFKEKTEMTDDEFKVAVLKALEAIRAEIYQLNVDVNITWKGHR